MIKKTQKKKKKIKTKRKLQHLLDFRLLCASCFPFFVQECVKIFYLLVSSWYAGVWGEDSLSLLLVSQVQSDPYFLIHV